MGSFGFLFGFVRLDRSGLVLGPFNIHLFPVRECGTAGALVLKPFSINLIPLWDCRTAGALVLHPLSIQNYVTAGVREQVFNPFTPKGSPFDE